MGRSDIDGIGISPIPYFCQSYWTGSHKSQLLEQIWDVAVILSMTIP